MVFDDVFGISFKGNVLNEKVSNFIELGFIIVFYEVI